tara:strand:+ start:545 stop:805 length:261 start_codon:yes stop_codon:yes gene_type:complete
MADNSKVFAGYTESPRISQRVSFTTEELDNLKQYATEKGRVYLTVVSVPHKDDNRKMKAFCEVYDPNSPKEQDRKAEKMTTTDIPF